MTKSEVLLLDEPSAIWNEMQKNPALRTDGDVWLHMTACQPSKTDSGLGKRMATRKRICIWT